MKISVNLPDYVVNCIENLNKNGFEAYAVGGCIRDSIIGRTPNDYDVTTNALPSDVKRIFPHVIPTGEKFGTSTVLFGKEQIEVTTYRYEGEYDDFRRPSKICFGTSLKKDLSRRDFTINAIAYSPYTGIADFFGGTRDIENGLIRTVGKPQKRFSEDALRIMRCFRFSSQLGFKIEENTFKSATELSGLLEKISAERIRDELFKIICSRFPENAESIIKCGDLKFLNINDKLYYPLNTLTFLPDIPDLKAGAFLYITRSPECISCLKLSNIQKHTMRICYSLLSSPLPQTPGELKRTLSKIGSFDYLSFLSIYSVIHKINTDPQKAFYNQVIDRGEPYKTSMLKINGNDLKLLGITDGPEIGRILNDLCEAVIEAPELNTKKELIRLVNNITTLG